VYSKASIRHRCARAIIRHVYAESFVRARAAILSKEAPQGSHRINVVEVIRDQ
jgi:hypothetical protein